MGQVSRRMDETTIQLSNTAVGAFQVFGAARAPVSHAGVRLTAQRRGGTAKPAKLLV
jgi:hypothetical protein